MDQSVPGIQQRRSRYRHFNHSPAHVSAIRYWSSHDFRRACAIRSLRSHGSDDVGETTESSIWEGLYFSESLQWESGMGSALQ